MNIIYFFIYPCYILVWKNILDSISNIQGFVCNLEQNARIDYRTSRMLSLLDHWCNTPQKIESF